MPNSRLQAATATAKFTFSSRAPRYKTTASSVPAKRAPSECGADFRKGSLFIYMLIALRNQNAQIKSLLAYCVLLNFNFFPTQQYAWN